MNLAHLYYYRKLVEVKNYSRAAEELFIAQPTLSLAVSSLERELGCALVKKKRNDLQLTEEGEAFYEAVITATNALDNVQALIAEKTQLQYGIIKIGTVYSIQDPAWSQAIRSYHRMAHSKVQLSWVQGTTEGLMRDLKNGSLDVIMAGILGKADPEVESIPAFAQSAVALVNRNSALSQWNELALDDLAPYPIITYRNKRGPFANEVEALFKGRRGMNVQFDYNDEITLASLVSASPQVVAVACHSWLLDAFHDVVPIPLTDAPRDFHRFYISYPKKGRLPMAVEEFVDFMRTYDFTNVSPKEEAWVKVAVPNLPF